MENKLFYNLRLSDLCMVLGMYIVNICADRKYTYKLL